MGEIVLFTPKAELDAVANLSGFVDICRNKLTVFGADLPFQNDVWDVTQAVATKGKGGKRERITFSNAATVDEKAPEMMREPFLSFAKAYVRYMHGMRPTKIIHNRVAALRAIEAALLESSAVPDPVQIDSRILNRAAQIVSDRFSDGAAYRVGGQIEMLGTFLAENRLTSVPVRWRNSIKRPSSAVRVGKEFDERRAEKMPSSAALDALPRIFRLATDPADVITVSVAAILLASPDRVSEVLTLPEACEVREPREGKEDAYGLRWWPAKGAEPMVKWLVPSMASVVEEALQKIRGVTEEARRIAKWYEQSPGQIYLAPDVTHLRGKEWLSLAEIAEIVGFSGGSAANTWCISSSIKTERQGLGKLVYARFSDVEAAVLAMLPSEFPILDKATGLKYSEALFVVRRNELGAQRGTYRCLIEPVGIGQVNTGLGSRAAYGHESIFTRLGFAEPDGRPIAVTSHQFRHYLNTLRRKPISHANRYDVTILVNGLPLVQVELKKRGVAIREAFNQVHRYSKESLNSEHSLFKYLQLFVISNGTDSRYFANTTQRNKNSFDFTMNWAKADNSLIRDLKDFTATFFQKHTLLNVLLHYSVFDVSDTLLVMRPYQIAATERILWKIKSAYQAKGWSSLEGGGYIWHTTGSGKTLTSFKAARLATELDFIDKVFFVVDRKDLDYQTMKEYQRFSPDSVNGSDSTAGLKRNLDKDDNKIVVTTIQKLNNLMKSEGDLPIYGKQVVFIFDECHRSQFGEAQKNLNKKFKRFYQFGFTGTPIFPENALGADTTASVFGRELHSYVITDAIRDEKVLKFKVDYNDVRPQFKVIETERDEKKLSAAENKEALLHPDRIREITQYILNNFRQKTHRLQGGNKGFNAMFAVSSVDAAKLYYECFRGLQKGSDKPLKVATIFSFAANEEQDAIGDIQDESFDVSAMNSSAKEFLSAAIADYNALFKTNFSVDSNGFQNYYRDLAKQVKAREIDLLIVVGMFLTGFDAPTLNTLFVDKNLRFHGLMQAYSRTNRIFDATKTFGNIVTFRDLEQATIDAITLFGDKNTKNVVLEKSYKEYMEGYTDAATGEARRGFAAVVNELETRFPDPSVIEKEADKKAFAKLFGEYLRVENVLQNYDEFASLKELQSVDMTDPAAVEAFKAKHYLNDEGLAALQAIKLPAERKIQDYRSTYNDVRDWLRREKAGAEKEKSTIDWDDVVFEVDLLKSQEINLDYILELIFEHNKKIKSKSELVDEVRRVIRASLGNRAKESLLVDFINQTDLDKIGDKASVIDAFFTFAQAEQQREAQVLISTENLNADAARRYITTSLKREFASDNGTELNAILPRMSPLNPQFQTKKQGVFQKIAAFVEKFKGVGGQV